MFKIFIILALLSFCLGGKIIPKNEENSYIVGGYPIEITSAPWHVALLYDEIDGGSYRIKCGGAILNEHAVVTSARCVNGTEMSRWRVRAGSKEWNGGGQLVGVIMAIVHPKYNPENSDYDVAVLHLSKIIKLDGETVKSVALKAQDEEVIEMTRGAVSGWGSRTGSGNPEFLLRQIILSTLKQDDCVKAYKGVAEITDRMLCAGEEISSCGDGDIGGTFVSSNFLIGLTSWGKECGEKNFPVVFTNISAVSQWIDDNSSHHPLARDGRLDHHHH